VDDEAIDVGIDEDGAEARVGVEKRDVATEAGCATAAMI
jgi:hypothetical protein